MGAAAWPLPDATLPNGCAETIAGARTTALLEAEEGSTLAAPCYTSPMSTWLPQRRADAGAVLLRDFLAPIVAVAFEACAH